MRVVASPIPALLLLALALAAVWWPVRVHYHVPSAEVSSDWVARQRVDPPDMVLAEVAEQSLISDHAIGGEQAVAIARRILQGRLELPHSPVLEISPRFDADDLAKGNGWQQFNLASLIVPDVLLRAYETVPEPAFFEAARTYLLNFLDDEARRNLPVGELWNGHAIATRVGVVARFWRLERRRTPHDERAARLVMAHVMRSGELLSKPSMFVVATNHGVMHNIGLLQIAAAFPTLPRSPAYRRLAIERLHEQMPFYVNDEGVVLEHSAGYHFHGVVMLAYVVRLLEMLGEPVPPAWIAQRDKALSVFLRLQRPDGTLPSFGNTMTYQWRLPPSVQRIVDTARVAGPKAAPELALYPVAGYAVATDRASDSPPVHVQTVVPWSHFRGHGHANAQEMSLLVWADGVDWISNVRYWPTDAPWGERAARGWSGGNAPHVDGEATATVRDTVLLASAEAEQFRLIDLQRRHMADGLLVRRQIVQVDTLHWLVFDTYTDPARRPLRVLWTTDPGVAMNGPAITPDGLGQRVVLRREGHKPWLSLEVRAAPSAVVVRRSGSRDPFAGWVSVDRSAVPAAALDLSLESPAGWMLSSMHLNLDEKDQRSSGVVQSVSFRSAEDWHVDLRIRGRLARVSRLGAVLSVTTNRSAGEVTRSVALSPGPDVSTPRAAIARALASVQGKYPRYRDIESYRAKASAVLAGGWLALQLMAWGVGRRDPRHATWRALAMLLWMAGAAWVLLSYLAV